MMGKRSAAGRCTYCLKHCTDLTKDHVFPKAWYPTDTDPRTQRWTVPVCQQCNAEYALIEAELLIKLGLCTDPRDPAAAGIPQKALRALSVAQGRDEADQKARKAKRKKILREMIRLPSPPATGVLPGFGPAPGAHYDRYWLQLVDKDSLTKLGEKIVRGLTYIADHTFIEDDCCIEVHILRQGPEADEVDHLLNAHGKVYSVYPAVVVTRAKAADEPRAQMCRIEIWQKLRMHATVMPREP